MRELINEKNFEILSLRTKVKELERFNLEMEEFLEQREKNYNKLKFEKNHLEEKFGVFLKREENQGFEEDDDL